MVCDVDNNVIWNVVRLKLSPTEINWAEVKHGASTNFIVNTGIKDP